MRRLPVFDRHLKNGIENMLRHFIPEVNGVEAI